MESLGLATLSSMAMRNLLRHGRRSLITIGMIAVGVAGLMFHRAFAEGSYETVNSRVQSGGGEKMVELAIKLLKELEGS